MDSQSGGARREPFPAGRGAAGRLPGLGLEKHRDGKSRRRDLPTTLAWILGFVAFVAFAAAADSGAVEAGILIALSGCLAAGALCSVNHAGKAGAVYAIQFPLVVLVIGVMAGIGGAASEGLPRSEALGLLGWSAAVSLFVGVGTQVGYGAGRLAARLIRRLSIASDQPPEPAERTR